MTDALGVKQCAVLLQRADRIVALTGAGISTAAGIPDFRGPQGLYVTRRYDPDVIFDVAAFHKDPGPFFTFARDFLTFVPHLRPTRGHHFLAGLENAGKNVQVITQNIDTLHQQAGSRQVIELHGSFGSGSCLQCGRTFNYTEMRERILRETVARCSCAAAGIIKPDIVFFGENVKHLPAAGAFVESADVLLVMGTSCQVYPAASLPLLAKRDIVIVNQAPIALPVMNVTLSVETDIEMFVSQLMECLPYAFDEKHFS